MNAGQSQSLIYYTQIDETGEDNPWLTMIHGFSHTHAYFSAQIPLFQENFKLLLADLRGHGQSVHIHGPYGIEEYADDIIAVLDDAGIEKTHYWGTHTGAAIGLVLALRYPDRFTSLVLEGTYLPGFDMPRVDQLLLRARTLAQSKGVQFALEDWFGAADWFDYIRTHPDQCRTEGHQYMVSEFQGLPWLSEQLARPVTRVANVLKAINHPVFIYNGEHDMPDFMRAAARLHTDIPNAQRAVIMDAGGFPGWENPQSVNGLIFEFLEKYI